uniref:Fe2OG dioxygenase domain-containing protein n=1 Tax=Chromera velia CCMP2878 TaxID=1169474 RepID=A0A0G4GDU6_9ALVE|eukprot:Cvel_21441.t1-p1 / transcript=Cvel_21441.t1 / gene=Cvel_21441 / organism=Chromera_velia_CCMP2878 / gene_product=hypothetical protein / transcript_product=hypothetical protein / location=Cvel_scaffold2010:23777-24265(-) / protein_length=163 / sequence_SO=supercontig / SO=protein_coding / is_pseudo=false
MEAEEEDEPVFCWHKDSQPFVLVCMISDVPAGARGGETAVKHADSTVLRLTFPAAGYAYLLQGSAIDHAALPARNFQRVTMITSYVPAETSMAEWTDLRLASLYSDRRELGDEFLLYRARRLQERLDRALSVHGCGDVEGALREMRKLREEVLHVERNLSYLQ